MRPPSFAKVPHSEPQPYLRLMRTVNYRWWRPVLGLLAFLGCYFVGAILVLLVAVVAGMSLDPLRLEDLTDPAVLALTNASLIVAIPAVWVAWAVHTERIGWSSSVLGRIRWRLMWRYGLIGLAVLGASTLFGLAFTTDVVTSAGFDASAYSLLVLVVLFSTPLQSAAEEYLFRGYLSQAISSWIPSVTTGAVLTGLITAALFSLIHLPGDFLTFFDRFAFGLAASAVVWLTGGLEAAIALHAANNVWVFLVYGALGDAPSSDIQGDPSTAALMVAVDVLVMGLYVWIVARTCKRWHPEILSRAGNPIAGVAPPAPPPHAPPGWGSAAPGWGGQSAYGAAPYAPPSSSGP
ncbi:MAG: CPBP family intramembrane metalloprotease [Actinomycetota bacterium]|nr:CPBP family intramembrane metalloprotease [Actinomycetota bacterium]